MLSLNEYFCIQAGKEGNSISEKNQFRVENVKPEKYNSCNLNKASNVLENTSFHVCTFYHPYCLFPFLFIDCVHPEIFFFFINVVIAWLSGYPFSLVHPHL